MIEGIRSKDEVDFFRERSENFRLVEVWVPGDIRMARIASRGRLDDASGDELSRAVSQRDARELGWGKPSGLLTSGSRTRALWGSSGRRRRSCWRGISGARRGKPGWLCSPDFMSRVGLRRQYLYSHDILHHVEWPCKYVLMMCDVIVGYMGS